MAVQPTFSLSVNVGFSLSHLIIKDRCITYLDVIVDCAFGKAIGNKLFECSRCDELETWLPSPATLE